MNTPLNEFVDTLRLERTFYGDYTNTLMPYLEKFKGIKVTKDEHDQLAQAAQDFIEVMTRIMEVKTAKKRRFLKCTEY